MRRLFRQLPYAALAACVLITVVPQAHAQTAEIRIARGFGITVLPIMVMENMKLIEKHAKAAGVEAKPLFVTQSAGTSHNDALNCQTGCDEPTQTTEPRRHHVNPVLRSLASFGRRIGSHPLHAAR